MNLFDIVPDELLLLIIGYFRYKDISLIRDMSKSFRKLTQNVSIMKSLITKDFGLSGLDKYNRKQLIRIFRFMSRNTISAGDKYLLALTDNGQVYSYGYNDYGQLGLGVFDSNKYGEGIIPLPENIIAVSTGSNYSLILTDNGLVYSFGYDGYGQLGLGDDKHRNVPKLIPSLKNIVAISAGKCHSLALTIDGKVYGFGCVDALARYSNGHSPELIPILENIIAISAGGYHSLALRSDGQVYSFGNNDFNQLGFSGYDQGPKLIPISNIVAISAGGHHSLALNKDGQVYSFGDNSSGQLGLGKLKITDTPKIIPELKNIISISAGYNHSLALTKDGQVYAFGSNYDYQLGLADLANRYTPEIMPLLRPVICISGGEDHSLLLFDNGSVISSSYYCSNLKLKL